MLTALAQSGAAFGVLVLRFNLTARQPSAPAGPEAAQDPPLSEPTLAHADTALA
jgi:hypothetical protein